MNFITGIVLMMLVGVSVSYPGMYAVSRSCKGTVTDHSNGTILQDCPVPSLFGNSFPKHIVTEVTQAATINDVRITWFLNAAGDPSLNVTFVTTSPDSAQEYTINVLADYFMFPIYCGKISTQRLHSSQPEEQTISLELTCLPKTLTPNQRGVVALEVKESSQRITRKFNLPDCQHESMYYSTKCVEERNKRISFELTQHENAVMVNLDIQKAYQNANSRVYLAISKRDESTFRNWAPVGEEITLHAFRMRATFTDLDLGATYQVVVWRPEEPAIQYADVITLKPDRKEERSPSFMDRIQTIKRSDW